MKQRTRSAAALVTTSLLAGGGIATAVTGLSHPPSAVTSTVGTTGTPSDPALSTAVHELLTRSQDLHRQLAVARQQLVVVDKRLHHQRQLARKLADAPVRTVHAATGSAQTAAGTAAGPTGTAVGGTPSTHATTRASSAPSSSTPHVHATTRASGGPRSAPTVHTTTRASGGRGHDDEGGGGDD